MSRKLDFLDAQERGAVPAGEMRLLGEPMEDIPFSSLLDSLTPRWRSHMPSRSTA